MASIKDRMRNGDTQEVSKPIIQAAVALDGDDVVIRFSRHMDMDSMREGDSSLFACVQGAPRDVSLMLTDRETGRVYKVPVDRKVNLNFFADWRKHNIVGRTPVHPPINTVEPATA